MPARSLQTTGVFKWTTFQSQSDLRQVQMFLKMVPQPYTVPAGSWALW